MDDGAYARVSQELGDWLGTVSDHVDSRSESDRYEVTVGSSRTRRALVIERAALLTRYIRARTTECQLRCEVDRIAVRHQAEATSDMRRKIEAVSRRVRSTHGSA